MFSQVCVQSGMHSVRCVFSQVCIQSGVCLSLPALRADADLMSLSGKTLTVTSGSTPTDLSSSDSLLCPYVNLKLMNASPAGELHSSLTDTH